MFEDLHRKFPELSSVWNAFEQRQRAFDAAWVEFDRRVAAGENPPIPGSVDRSVVAAIGPDLDLPI